MKKCIHVVYINDYYPELWSLTYPLILHYAKKINADINVISERKFPDWHMYYEKMQMYEYGKYYDANFLLDADVLIHPGFPDFTTVTKPHHIAFNDNFNASDHYYGVEENIYFQRDGRDVGISTNAVISFKSTHDVWEPLNISPQEAKNILKPHAFIDEYCLSLNMAKYGLKYTGITWEEWQRYYFIHLGNLGSKNTLLQNAYKIIEKWKRDQK